MADVKKFVEELFDIINYVIGEVEAIIAKFTAAE